MEPRTQDAIERLIRNAEWSHLMHYVMDRLDVYHTSLATVDPARVDFIAQYQGRVAAYKELLEIEQYIKHLKAERTHNDG